MRSESADRSRCQLRLAAQEPTKVARRCIQPALHVADQIGSRGKRISAETVNRTRGAYSRRIISSRGGPGIAGPEPIVPSRLIRKARAAAMIAAVSFTPRRQQSIQIEDRSRPTMVPHDGQ